MTLLHMIYCSVILGIILYISLYYCQIYYSFFPMHYLYCPFIFIFPFHGSLFALAGPVLTDLDFSASEFEKTGEPLYEGTQGDYHAWVRSSLFLCILEFCLIKMTRCQIVSFVFLSCYFLTHVSRQRLLHICISYMWKINIWLSLVYVCENLAPLL